MFQQHVKHETFRHTHGEHVAQHIPIFMAGLRLRPKPLINNNRLSLAKAKA